MMDETESVAQDATTPEEKETNTEDVDMSDEKEDRTEALLISNIDLKGMKFTHKPSLFPNLALACGVLADLW